MNQTSEPGRNKPPAQLRKKIENHLHQNTVVWIVKLLFEKQNGREAHSDDHFSAVPFD